MLVVTMFGEEKGQMENREKYIAVRHASGNHAKPLLDSLDMGDARDSMNQAQFIMNFMCSVEIYIFMQKWLLKEASVSARMLSRLFQRLEATYHILRIGVKIGRAHV